MRNCRTKATPSTNDGVIAELLGKGGAAEAIIGHCPLPRHGEPVSERLSRAYTCWLAMRTANKQLADMQQTAMKVLLLSGLRHSRQRSLSQPPLQHCVQTRQNKRSYKHFVTPFIHVDQPGLEPGTSRLWVRQNDILWFFNIKSLADYQIVTIFAAVYDTP